MSTKQQNKQPTKKQLNRQLRGAKVARVTIVADQPLPEQHPKSTLLELEAWLLACTSMEPCRRYERVAAIRRLPEWLGVEPETIPAEPIEIRKRFAKLSPGAIGVTRKRISNNKSCVLAALRAAGILPKHGHVNTFLPAWLSIWEILSPAERRQLSRLFRYASARNLTPEMIDEAVSAKFLDHLTNETLTKGPKIAHQNAIRTLNKVGARAPEFPCKRLIVPRYMQRLCVPDDKFPQSLWDEFDAFCVKLGTKDYFDKNTTKDPLRKISIESYAHRFRMYLAALVLAGCDPKTITSLAFCVQEQQVEKGLRALLAWRQTPGSEARHSAALCAILLQTIAKRAVKDATKGDLEFLKHTAGSLRVRHKGMSPRSKKRVAALKHPANLARLFILPLALAKKLVALPDDDITDSDALALQKVLALILLMFCPLRILTLSSLHLDDHLVWAGPDMAGDLLLEIPAELMKGDHPATMPLPGLCANLIREYVRRFRVRLAPSGSRFLFSGKRVDKPKDENLLSKQLKALVFEKLGFDVTPHVYRHIVHIVILNRFPGAYAMIARVLTHSNINVCIKNYSYMDVELSMRAYQELVMDEVTVVGPRKKPTAADIAYSLGQERL